MASIFEHLDYRTFLGAWYAEEKARSGVSYRSIAAKVGYASPGFFTQILQGKTNIRLETAEGFANLTGLRGRAREYFLTLVVWNQAKDAKVRSATRAKLEKFHEFKIRDLTSDQERFLEAWHHAAIREVLGITPFRGDYHGLAASLVPAITAEAAQQSIELLLSMGLAARTSKGVVRRDPALSSGHALAEASTNRFFRELHTLGLAAMDHFPKAERNMSWVTISVSDRVLDEIVEELRSFRRRVLEIAQRDDKPTRVHQLTILMHPLSQRIGQERV